MPKKPVVEDWMPKCASCAFFVPDAQQDVGECRRYPPAVFPEDGDSVGFSFALTQIDQWCGEFRRRVN